MLVVSFSSTMHSATLKKCKVFMWALNSPNLNPIQHLWDVLYTHSCFLESMAYKVSNTNIMVLTVETIFTAVLWSSYFNRSELFWKYNWDEQYYAGGFNLWLMSVCFHDKNLFFFSILYPRRMQGFLLNKHHYERVFI